MDKILLDVKLFEEFPLYRKFQIQLPQRYQINQGIKLPGIRLFCPVCNSENTFTSEKIDLGIRQRNQIPGPNDPSLIAGKSGSVTYVCASCKDYHQFYFLYFDINLSYVMKIGQYPAWSISIEKNLEGVLGGYEDIYRKGLICESQGYGIGAYAYYRRIVENIIDKLLDSISSLLEENEESEAYKEALRQTKSSIVAKEKIALVKDLLPKSLRCDNMNPLSILHDQLSFGIHKQTDEDCLEHAGYIREILVYIVKRITLAMDEKKSTLSFTESMRKLLDKKNQQKI